MFHLFLRLCSLFAFTIGTLVMLASGDSTGQTIKGQVVGVHDGDSITVLAPGKTQLKVRLEGIDAPELKQAFSQQAKQALSDLVFSKKVVLRVTGTDRYRRTLAVVMVGNLDVNREMVLRGFAWHFVKYSKDEALGAAERTAKANRRGLWADPAPVPPWEWRKQKKAPQQRPLNQTVSRYPKP